MTTERDPAMRAFWWFQEGRIAGMARPGFNAVHWIDLPFQEALLLSWLGQLESGEGSLQDFREHLRGYAPKVFPFYGLDASSGERAIEPLRDPAQVLVTGLLLADRTAIFEALSVEDGTVRFTINPKRLQFEVDYLKSRGIRQVISLTEHHHSKEVLERHFETRHFSIPDLHAPTVDQAHALAETLREAGDSGKSLAVHCLAGIGRTSTMILAAHLLLGEELAELHERVRLRNPQFKLLPAQERFLEEISGRARRE